MSSALHENDILIYVITRRRQSAFCDPLSATSMKLAELECQIIREVINKRLIGP